MAALHFAAHQKAEELAAPRDVQAIPSGASGMKFIDCEGELYLKDGFGRFPSPYNVGGFNVGGFGDEQLPASSDGVSMLASARLFDRGTSPC
jgi:hypothetical protein